MVSAERPQNKVLIAERDGRAVALVREILAARGIAVVAVSDTREALQKALHEMPDAILLDAAFAGMGGLDLCTMIKRNPRTRAIPLGLLVGRDIEPHSYKAAQQAGALVLIPKPIKALHLLCAVDLLLSGRPKKVAAWP